MVPRRTRCMRLSPLESRRSTQSPSATHGTEHDDELEDDALMAGRATCRTMQRCTGSGRWQRSDAKNRLTLESQRLRLRLLGVWRDAGVGCASRLSILLRSAWSPSHVGLQPPVGPGSLNTFARDPRIPVRQTGYSNLREPHKPRGSAGSRSIRHGRHP